MAKGQTGSSPPSAESTLPTMLLKPWAFLRPTNNLHAQIADSAKQILDPLATSVVNDQALRRQINKKRKRVDAELDGAPPLQMKNLYVDGFTSNQIWEQATRILESAGREVERDITLLARNSDYPSSADEDNFDSLDVSDPEGSGSDSDDADSMSDDFSDNTSLEENEGGMDGESDNLDDEVSEDARAMDEAMSDDEGSVDRAEEDTGTYVEDRFGLNDGFFSIDDFNKQTELWERQDAKGTANDADDSSDEEVDWHANPIETGDNVLRSKAAASRTDDTNDSSDEDGPTFGNADLHGDSDSDEDAFDTGDADMGGFGNANDIKYADFFAPPPRKASSKKARALPKTQPAAEDLTEGDVSRAMADVRRDLFDEESEAEGEEDEQLDEADDSHVPRSTHEKQRARIADEIRRLEAANVAKKEWMLVGEARAVERPVNSLIEEDLDFERVGKPVPVVTNETTEDIEELVKRRILAKEFDEVVRRRPGASDAQPRRGRFELEDTKPQQSLAEMYEADHLRATDSNYVDPKNQKLMRERAEVTDLWKAVSSTLDLLCNWNYKPQAPQASINVVNDAPTIMMEDARPTAGSAVAGPSALAPQEIYTPGNDGRVAGEMVLKTGATISKDEMSREEKARMRRQKKSQRREDGPTRPSGKAGEKQEIVSALKKGGVKVINKEGQVTDMSGAKVGAATKSSADTLKL
ncbi:uncharacterized protein N7482_002318 [Penicillium canariense]|uniref:U3 small nucleolar ribonucleoprotein protein MPP10 n=1 Tax=Penicillium canariense TaxID=189055 RepID=A0A9W9ILJ4_9EURO|nr:uncharacterized protein N7482_002318 [Penicillium canariense]KAJ5176441.1 hypothetical protein N7482_002318 [Penicillium canariense]